jgi:hypothetical protein
MDNKSDLTTLKQMTLMQLLAIRKLITSEDISYLKGVVDSLLISTNKK